MDEGDPVQQAGDCSGCSGCAARDRVIADQARALERVTSELRWHGLDDDALTVRQGYASLEAAKGGDKNWATTKNRLAPTVRHLGDLPCLQVTPARWVKHRAVRAAEACGRWAHKKLTSFTLDEELRFARMMFRWLVRADQLSRNPLELAEYTGDPAGRETYLPAVDVQRLVDGATVLGGASDVAKRRVLLFRAWVLAKFMGGLRFEEVRHVRRDRIGADGILELSAKRTKSKRKRTIAFPDIVLDAFTALPVLDGDPRVFTHQPDRGRCIGKVVLVSPMCLRTWFHRVCKSTGVDKLAAEGEVVVPHVLRHSAASHAEEQGAHPMDIKDFLGHASLATTERYLHRRPAQRAVRMAEYMGGSKVGRG